MSIPHRRRWLPTLFDSGALITAAKFQARGLLVIDHLLACCRISTLLAVKQESELGRSVSVELDERLERFVDHAQRSKSRSAPEISADLMRAGYLDVVGRPHRQYLEGQITLREMAAELGLEYREVYALLEELDLPVA